MAQLHVQVNSGNDSRSVCFRPGDTLTGQLQITAPTAMQILHLRVVFYGHVQVHGERPDQPLQNGIFDYLRNEQLINSGVRIARRPSLVTTGATPSTSAAATTSTSAEHTMSVISRLNTATSSSTASQHHQQQQQNGKKTRVDRLVESLIRQCAVHEQSNATMVCHDLKLYDFPPSHVYTVAANSKQHRVKYSVPIPPRKPIPASFSHAHCPIRYYAIAIMLHKTIETKGGESTYRVSFARVPVQFEPIVNVMASTFTGLLRESTRIWLGSQRSVFFSRLTLARLRNKSVCTLPYTQEHAPHDALASLSSTSSAACASEPGSLSSYASLPSLRDKSTVAPLPSSKDVSIRLRHERASLPPSSSASPSTLARLASWCSRLILFNAPSNGGMLRQHTWLPLSGKPHRPVLDCTLDLPRRAFCRGKSVPLSVRLVNGAGIRIALVVIDVKLVRIITMTGSVGETLESSIVMDHRAVFYGDEVDPPFNGDTNDVLEACKRDEDASDISSLAVLERQPFFLFTTREMQFDLSRTLLIPEDSTCTIPSGLTRNTFELGYQWITKAKQGPQLDATLDDHDQRVARYYDRINSHRRQELPLSDYRVHVLDLPKIDLVIGNA
ncbi:hypothetical protein BC940DRAFT_287809 [Gongronella butleri]|nr:hypothetical protein BC940DRAFT_287809 [Gongronella butleri]